MTELLSALLGFFFTVTILLVLFDNCSFNMGCGGKYATQAARWPYSERMANYAGSPEPEVAMEEVGAVDSPVANDSVEGFASVNASGTGVPMKQHTGILNPMPDDAANVSHPFGPMVRDHEPYGSSTPGNTNCVITCPGGPGKHY